jgi:anti-sigma factor RsiW
MKHLDEGVLQQAVDGELAAEDRAEVDGHLASCPRCQAEFAELRDQNARASALLGMLEDAPVLATAHAEFTRRRFSGRRGPRVEVRRVLLKAAVLVLTVTGVAVAAAPGSPVREWISETVLPQRAVVATEMEPEPPVEVEEMRAPTGVFILPEAGRVRVVLSAPNADLEVHTRLTTDSRAEVYASGEAAGARFRTSPGRIEVMGAGPGELHVALPLGATHAYVEVNGTVYVAKDGDRLRVLAPHATGTPAAPVFRVGG